MQSKSRTYAEALKDVLLKSSSPVQKERIKNFKKLLKRRGDLKLLTKILQEFQKLWKERNGKIGQAISAKPLSRHIKERAKNELSKKGFLYEEKIDPSVLGGIALILSNEYLIDNTIRGKLERLQKQRTP